VARRLCSLESGPFTLPVASRASHENPVPVSLADVVRPRRGSIAKCAHFSVGVSLLPSTELVPAPSTGSAGLVVRDDGVVRDDDRRGGKADRSDGDSVADRVADRVVWDFVESGASAIDGSQPWPKVANLVAPAIKDACSVIAIGLAVLVPTTTGRRPGEISVTSPWHLDCPRRTGKFVTVFPSIVACVILAIVVALPKAVTRMPEPCDVTFDVVLGDCIPRDREVIDRAGEVEISMPWYCAFVSWLPTIEIVRSRKLVVVAVLR